MVHLWPPAPSYPTSAACPGLLTRCWLSACAHVPSCKLHERLFVMKRRHNEEEECIKDLPRGPKLKGQFSLERLSLRSYILQRWMIIRMTDRIMTFHSEHWYFLFLTSGYFTLLSFSYKKERITLLTVTLYERKLPRAVLFKGNC